MPSTTPNTPTLVSLPLPTNTISKPQTLQALYHTHARSMRVEGSGIYVLKYWSTLKALKKIFSYKKYHLLLKQLKALGKEIAFIQWDEVCKTLLKLLSAMASKTKPAL